VQFKSVSFFVLCPDSPTPEITFQSYIVVNNYPNDMTTDFETPMLQRIMVKVIQSNAKYMYAICEF
jgi:hypothetical protein